MAKRELLTGNEPEHFPYREVGTHGRRIVIHTSGDIRGDLERAKTVYELYTRLHVAIFSSWENKTFRKEYREWYEGRLEEHKRMGVKEQRFEMLPHPDSAHPNHSQILLALKKAGTLTKMLDEFVKSIIKSQRDEGKINEIIGILRGKGTIMEQIADELDGARVMFMSQHEMEDLLDVS